MNLYELTRKLISRGCPDHPRLEGCCWKDDRGIRDVSRVVEEAEGVFEKRGVSWYFQDSGDPCCEDDATDLWTAHALRWHCARTEQPIGIYNGGVFVGDVRNNEWPAILEAIEAATRHLDTDDAHDADRKSAEPGCT